ncbi:hypothetical protein ACO0K0_02580 [Undibacterium sp. SXout11W]|uniref:hypothetical protein n=1 Tax=Undibacterium sp. SXout11W TaxID=3413050 RepID=UPI003BF386C5
MKNQIPEVTHQLGKHWEQPQRECILIDDQHALLSRSDFNKLSEYSSTIPSGVYEGKMWKRLDGLFDPLCKPCNREWLLCWFGFGIDKGRCSINFRKILIAEELTGAA